MATLSKTDSRRMYSWWWNSHISPKNSKWLQENLTDMDSKVKSMIKLIEEDADSFARRAEMYYKKRPELMKLVEEFYRAYRALAERYDHATGALRHAHKTMAEAFPNQVPSIGEDSPANSVCDGDPQTPEMRIPTRASFDLEDLQKDALDLSSSNFCSRKRSEALLDEGSDVKSGGSKGSVRKGLKFDEPEDGNQKHRSQARVLSESEHVGMADKEILLLKEALDKLENEKESGLKQYQESLERLSKLESEISHAQQDSRELTERASKAEAETQTLKDALQRLEVEKEESLKLYHQCLNTISNLESSLSRAEENVEELNEQAKNDELEVQSLKQNIARLEDEKNAAHDQYKQSMEMKSQLEKRLMEAEEEAKNFRERAEKAESEVETLKLAIAELTEEKEAQALLHRQCLETISSLELRLSCAQEEAERLNGEIGNGLSMLKSAEEQRLMLERSNQTLHTELESVLMKMGAQTQELTEKQKELGRLWTCIQEERLRFVEAETAFQTLQHLHSQSQEELRSLASELQNRAQILLDMETRNQGLQGEIQKQIEENENLNEMNMSYAVSMKDMQTEISCLKESKGKLEEEVDLRVDQRNALQQEIYCLKEELNELNKNHQSILEQVSYVGLNPESFGSSVKELQDENSSLKEEFQTERSAKEALLEKLEIMGRLLDKNAVLENSLSDLGVELEGARGKIKALEESYQSLLEEKSTLAVEKANLLGQLQVTTDNLIIVSEKNTVLEDSLFNAHVELELLKQKSKSFEDSCHLLAEEKSALISEKGTLVSQMQITEKSLKDLELRYTDLEEKYSAMAKERESTLRKVEELHVSLAVQNQEHVAFAQMNEKHLRSLRNQIQLLQQESRNRSEEFDQELDKAFGSETEIFILLRCVQDLEEKNFSLLTDCQKLQEASKMSERLIHELEKEKNEIEVKIKSVSDQNNRFRTGMHQLLKVAGIALNPGYEEGQDQACFDSMRSKVEGTNRALIESEEKNTELIVEMSILVTLLRQLKTELADLEAEKHSIHQELSFRTARISDLQSEAQKLSETNEELKSKVTQGDQTEEVLRTQLESLHGDLSIVQGAYRSLQMENSVVLEEKMVLTKNNFHINEKLRALEKENCIIFDEVLCKNNLSFILENYLDEKYAEINGLGEDLQMLHGVNSTLVKRISVLEKKLEEVQAENLHLKETLQKSEHQLETVVSVRDQLNSELENVNASLHIKETEYMEAAQQLTILENEKTELSNVLVGLQKEHEEVKMARDEQGKQIHKLSEDNDNLSKEHMSLHEATRLLELKMHQLGKEHETTKREEETHASAVYSELQTSTFRQVIFEEKVRELAEVCISLQEESTSKDADIESLKQRTGILECENGDLKAHLASYGPALLALRECVLTLENRTSIRTSIQKSENEKPKGAESTNLVSEYENTVRLDALADLQDLQTKVKAIETAMAETEKLTTQEKLATDAKLESATRQLEELRRQKTSRRPTSTSEISEADPELLPKDIMLDQASECSSYGISKRELGDGEIWETTADTNVVDFTKEAIKLHPSAAASDWSIEKEPSKRFKEPNKRKVLERLNSDVQKLTNLQITIEDLRKKVRVTEKGRRGKAMVECETIKGQLMEAESDIQKLYELNGKLVKHVEADSSTPGKSTPEPDESQSQSQSQRRKRVSEQARRASEKIARWQLELQKIQFVLLKLDDEKEATGKGKSRFLEGKKRVLLKDYLYGGRTKASISGTGKKRHLCSCVEPATKGD